MSYNEPEDNTDHGIGLLLAALVVIFVLAMLAMVADVILRGEI